MLLTPVLMKHMTDGFKLVKMQVDFPAHPEWEVPFDPELMTVLDQPFHYLDKGSQCFVFESEDQKYVIKFFRFNAPYSELKVFTLFNAAQIAYERLKEETGLLYIHLNPTEGKLPTLHCTDAIGRSYHFQLDECRFAIQKRAKQFQCAIEEALKDPALMQKRIDQFVDLLLVRTEKGIYNSDPSLHRNFGFLEDRAIEIDFGNYRPSSPHSREVEIERYAGKLRHYLMKEAPEWAKYLVQKLKNSLKQREPG